MSLPQGPNNDGPERSWLDHDVDAVEDRPADPAASLVSLGFIAAALRRSAWFWRVTAVVGLLLGTGLYLKGPHPYQASTTLILTVGAESQPGTAILEDQALAHGQTVAALTLQKLGLHQSVNSFLGSYTVTPITDRILQITASGPSSSEAVRRANALATEFLTFRANELLLEQRLEFSALDQQITQDKQGVTSTANQTSHLSAPPGSSSKRGKSGAARARAGSAGSDLADLEQAVNASKAAAKVTTASMIGGSKVLDGASPVPPHSRTKRLLLYAVGGLIIGLILAMAIIVLRALLSDRLRRRDDIAQALGAPVRSVARTRGSRRLTGRGGHVPERIIAYLRDAVPADSRGPASLAVIPADDPQVAAMSVVTLALSYAQEGKRVVVADLAAGAPAAGMLGARGPGVHTVRMDGAHLVAAVLDPGEFAPIGPLGRISRQGRPGVADELSAACVSANVVLTLIQLDPSVGGDHLATWAADAVVVVTAARSSWTKIHAIGEMVRLSGTRLALAVLIGADKTDESLGVSREPVATRDGDGMQGGQADEEGSFAGGPGGRPSDGWQVDPAEHMGRRRRSGP
jgi:capsular polysaccharide biosynthesis protein